MLMESKTFLLVISVHLVVAWLPPERCKQGNFVRTKRDSTAYPNFIISAPNVLHAPVVNNITQIALNQNKNLNETYIRSKFFGVPIKGYSDGRRGSDYEMYAANKCKFYTYNPSLLSSVYCQEGVACKLTHAVSTTKSYTASEGHNWGVKISAKATIIPSVFEVGGEVSTGDSYTCTYTEGRTTTDTVECSVGATAAGKTLQLYNVQSDLECQFSTVTMVPDTRNGEMIHEHICWNFTQEEGKSTFEEAIFHATIKDEYLKYERIMVPDLDRMSEEIWEKMKFCFPDYIPYTDLIDWPVGWWTYAMYYKEGKVAAGAKRVIPFTNENGNSVYQYACVLT